jgi:sporulation protein YlmC with PRC-barrel domain
MCCRIVDLKDKQVISIKDGCCLGYVYDVEIDTCNGKLVSIVVPQKPKFLDFSVLVNQPSPSK